MSAFNRLDVLIQESTRTIAEYNMMRWAINEHVQGKVKHENLPPEAQLIMREWESQHMAGAV